MNGNELEAAIRDLDSDDLTRKIHAVDVLAAAGAKFAALVVKHLADPEPAKYLVYERLGRFGAAAMQPLSKVLGDATDPATRILASAALLALGSRSGIPVLLNSVRWDDPKYVRCRPRSRGHERI